MQHCPSVAAHTFFVANGQHQSTSAAGLTRDVPRGTRRRPACPLRTSVSLAAWRSVVGHHHHFPEKRVAAGCSGGAALCKSGGRNPWGGIGKAVKRWEVAISKLLRTVVGDKANLRRGGRSRKIVTIQRTPDKIPCNARPFVLQ